MEPTKIEHIYAVVRISPEGIETLCAMKHPDLGDLQAVTTNLDKAELMLTLLSKEAPEEKLIVREFRRLLVH